MLKSRDKAPDFVLPDQTGKVHKLSDNKGRWVFLYFYPKDDTPGCTVEACSVRDNIEGFNKLAIPVFGISVDPVESHKKFTVKYKLNFPLLSDEEKKAVRAYGAWQKKKFLGREYMGTVRMSFLIDPRGRIAKIYPKVKPLGHADEVLRDLRELKAKK